MLKLSAFSVETNNEYDDCKIIGKYMLFVSVASNDLIEADGVIAVTGASISAI
jgi:hypothetical protein